MTLGIAQNARQAGWNAGVYNARQVGTASTNSSQTYAAQGTAGYCTTSTTQKKFGTASMRVLTDTSTGPPPGRDGYLATTTQSPSWWDFGTGDFTIEWWIYIIDPLSSPTHNNYSEVFVGSQTGSLGARYAQAFNTNGLSAGANAKYFAIFAANQADLDYWTLPSSWVTNTWHFCVLQRKSASLSFWVDGALQSKSGSGGNTRNFASSNTSMSIGEANSGDNTGVYDSYIDEMCVSNGFARYLDLSAPIPVPAVAFTVDSYTSQLLHFDGADGGTTFTNATS
jgi:hypothetical protein